MADLPPPTVNYLRRRRLFCALLHFSWLLLPCNATGEEQSAKSEHYDTVGRIEGLVTYDDVVPKSRLKNNSGQPRNLLVVQRRTGGVQFVLAYLDYDGSKQQPPLDGRAKKAPIDSVPIVDQVEHEFRPHLLAVRHQQSVKFMNSDAANHNVRATAFESKNQFNVYTTMSEPYVHRFVAGKKPRPISLTCDLHPWMQGWIFVFTHPHFAVSDEHGKFALHNVPLGNQRLVLWHPDVGYRKTFPVEVVSGKAVAVTVNLTAADLKLR